MSTERKDVDTLLEKLSVGIAKFTYTKTDGSERSAVGTRCAAIIPKYPDKNVEELVKIANMVMGAIDTEYPQMLGDTAIPELAPMLEKALKPFNRVEREKAENTEIINYYDLEAKGWRSCKTDSILGVE